LDRTFSDQEREVGDLSDEELAVVAGGMMQFPVWRWARSPGYVVWTDGNAASFDIDLHARRPPRRRFFSFWYPLRARLAVGNKSTRPTPKEIARITAGAVIALVIVGWLLILAIAFMSAR